MDKTVGILFLGAVQMHF